MQWQTGVFDMCVSCGCFRYINDVLHDRRGAVHDVLHWSANVLAAVAVCEHEKREAAFLGCWRVLICSVLCTSVMCCTPACWLSGNLYSSWHLSSARAHCPVRNPLFLQHNMLGCVFTPGATHTHAALRSHQELLMSRCVCQTLRPRQLARRMSRSNARRIERTRAGDSAMYRLTCAQCGTLHLPSGCLIARPHVTLASPSCGTQRSPACRRC